MVFNNTTSGYNDFMTREDRASTLIVFAKFFRNDPASAPKQLSNQLDILYTAR